MKNQIVPYWGKKKAPLDFEKTVLRGSFFLSVFMVEELIVNSV